MWPLKNKKDTAFKEWLDQAKPNGHTWDAWKLEGYQFQPIFIYGDMKRRHRKFPFIDDYTDFRGIAFTANDNWIMWKKKLGEGTFPIAMRIDHTMVPKARIKGELFLIDSTRILELDEIMLNGVEFRRKHVDILIPYCHMKRIVNEDHNYEIVRTDLITPVSAWMYIGRYKYWSDHLDAGYNFSPCKRYHPSGLILPGSYYDFTELELND